MDWIIVTSLAAGLIGLAAQALSVDGPWAETCARCGGDMEFTPDSFELLRLGLTTTLPAMCAACGATGRLLAGARGQEP